MALELKYEITYNTDLDKIIITDTTGVYDVNNTTGWGAPNPSRASVALVLYAKYNNYDLPQTNLSLVNDVIRYSAGYTNDEESVFELDYVADGWYTYGMAAVPTANGAPVANDIIFDTGLSRLQIYKDAAFTDLVSADWEYLLVADIVTVKQEITFLKLICKRNELLEELISCYQCTSCKCQDKENELLRLNIFIQGADYRFHSQKEFEAQRMVEILTKQFKC